MTDIDTKRIRDLLDQRDAIDAELSGLFTGTAPKKEITCSKCQAKGHTARTCPQKENDGSQQ